VPFELKGYVRDENGVPVVGADIHLVVIDDNNDTLPYDFQGATNSDGYYIVWPGINEPGNCLGYSGDSVQVSAVSGERSGSAQVMIPYNSTLGAWQNITVAKPPENPLTGYFGLAMLGIILAVVVIFVIWLQVRRKMQESSLEGKRAPKRKRRGRR